MFDYSDFSNVSGLALNGNAAATNGLLRLTTAAQNQAGSAFYATPIALSSSTSFQTSFQFKAHGGGSSSGADGFAFVLQNSARGATALGVSGGSLGYDNPGTGQNAKIQTSLAIEFDTYKNGWDSSNNEVSVLRDGNVANHLARVSPAIDLNGGQLLTTWIDYDGDNNQLTVYLSNNGVKPGSALLAYEVDLPAIVGTQMYVGFTAGTGGLTNNQDIQEWNFSTLTAIAPGSLSFGSATYSANEAGGSALITVNRSGGSLGSVSVDYATTNGTAIVGSDYTGTSGTLTFDNGEISKTFAIPILNDSALETSETINLVLNTPTGGASLGIRNTASLSIIDNDSPVGAGTGLQAEYFDNVDLTNLKLTRTDATVNFNWGNGSPDTSIGADTFSARWTGQVQSLYSENYTFFTTADDGVRLWVNGQQIINRWVDQAPTESAGTISLVAGQKYNIRLEYYERGGGAVSKLAWSSASQVKEIIPQSRLFTGLPDTPGTLALAPNTPNPTIVNESAGSVAVNLVRTGGSDGTISATYQLNDGVDGTVLDGAIAGSDYQRPYTGALGTVVFAPGELSKTIVIPILNDSVQERGEVFTVSLNSTDGGASLGIFRTVQIEIVDDDTPPPPPPPPPPAPLPAGTFAFSSATYSVSEAAAMATIAVTRSGGSLGDVTVAYATGNGTATAGSDYTSGSGVLSFAAGETSKTFAVPILNDTLPESNETVNLTLSAPTGNATLAAQNTTAVLTISDNDTANLVRESVVSGLTEPTMIDWTPDGQKMLIAQKNGVVRIHENGTLLTTPFIDISSQVNGARDRGLLGLTIHPDFYNGSPYVYLLFTYDPPETAGQTGLAAPDTMGNRPARLIRVTADAANNYRTAIANSEVVLLGQNSLWKYTSRPNGNSTSDFSIPPSGIVNGVTITDNNIPGSLGDIPDALIEINTATGVKNIKDYIATDSESHTVGSVQFGSDGSLFVSVGDGASYGAVDPRAVRVQDLHNLSGKILRIDPITGAGLANNPFYDGDASSNISKVYNYGLRNPFRFTVEQSTNTPYIGDVGWTTWEEINVGAGKNFGWPFYEGGYQNGSYVSLKTGGYQSRPEATAFYASNPNVTAPTLAQHHNGSFDPLGLGGSGVIIMGDFYTGNTFPSAYQNALFYADANKGFVNAVTFNPNGSVASVLRFATGLFGVVQIATGPDSNLYYTNLSGQVGRWRPA